MKWGIVLLLLLGVVAAACAAVLVKTLKADPAGIVGEDSSASIEVGKAKKPLPAMTVITLEHLVKETVSKGELPEGQVSRPAQVIGRVLSVPVVEGQILTESCFVTEGAGALLAAALPHGMRAVSVNLSSRGIAHPVTKIVLEAIGFQILIASELNATSNDYFDIPTIGVGRGDKRNKYIRIVEGMQGWIESGKLMILEDGYGVDDLIYDFPNYPGGCEHDDVLDTAERVFSFAKKGNQGFAMRAGQGRFTHDNTPEWARPGR